MSKPRRVIELDEAIARAAQWVEAQIAANPYCDVGFLATVHDGTAKKISYTVTTKSLPRTTGGHHAERNR